MIKIDSKQKYIQMYTSIQEKGLYKKIRIILSKDFLNNFTHLRYNLEVIEGIILNVTPHNIWLKIDSKEINVRIKEIKEYEFK